LSVLLLHHRFASNLFIFRVLEEREKVGTFYEQVSEELSDCLCLIYIFNTPVLQDLRRAASKECNMVINYNPIHYPEMDQLTDLIEKFADESKVSYPRTGDWMLLDMNICKPQVEHNQLKSTSTTDEFDMKPEAVTYEPLLQILHLDLFS
jgi:hypothetical protein